MSKFQPEFENLELRQLLAADLEPGEVFFDGLRFATEPTSAEICFKTSQWRTEANDFDAADQLAETLSADEHAWSVESQIQTDEELVFAGGEPLEFTAVDVRCLVQE